ncbi:MAG TPA: NADPH-dependent F420 reductase [Candidatus Thermoplasmatota archaeon]|nr:NADPH-dependent F420 reductase [Candidatus Thermoplasmatota archaeon]
MRPKIGIIGRGNVGSALREGLGGVGYEVRMCGNEPAAVREVGSWSDVVVLAVPFPARQEVAARVRDDVAGKTVVDVTNALNADYSFEPDPRRTSGAEELQGMLPQAKVVKAFNTVFAPNMRTGKVKGEVLTLFVAGDSEEAKATVRDLARDIGFDAVDAGPLKNARWMETLGYFNIELGFGQKMGTDIGFRLVR